MIFRICPHCRAELLPFKGRDVTFCGYCGTELPKPPKGQTENERQAEKIRIAVGFNKSGTISDEDLVRYMLNQEFTK